MAMVRTKGGCGCAVAALVAVLGALGFVGYKFILPWWNKKPPAPSGKELRVYVLDVGQGDAILILPPVDAPEGKTVLVDAGDEKNGKRVVEALKAKGVQQLDYFVATHAHPDHIGGAAEVFNNFKVGVVLHNDFPPPEVVAANEAAAATPQPGGRKQKPQPKPPARGRGGRAVELPPVKAYNGFKSGADKVGAEFRKAEPEQRIELGGGALLTVLAPQPPPFTREQIASSRNGNESNANSIVMRLDYGEFSMLLTGDAEAQSEERLVSKELELEVDVLKVAHHGSKYATSEGFLRRVKPRAAVISMAEFNRYGHPDQGVLGRLKAAGVTELYRTDFQGEIEIKTTGKVANGKLYEVKAAKETKSDLWAGREGEKNDSSSSGFISYGDYGPPPKQRKK
jgi:competence protein ComEC